MELPHALRGEGDDKGAVHRQALRVRLPEETCTRLWPLAETRYRLSGAHTGKAITLVATNPHYHGIHPEDGGVEEGVSDSGNRYTTKYVIVHFLLDDVRETAASS